MINRTAKGRRKEKICADELKADGYIVWKTIRHKFLNIDLFGLFDVVGLAGDGTHLKFIQVKTGYCPNEVKDKIRALKMPVNCIKEVWCYFDRAGWRKETL